MKPEIKNKGAQRGNKNATGNPGGGAIGKYRKEYDADVFALCVLGLTDKELAEYFEISESTLNLWKKDHSSFSESLKKGKIVADSKVAMSLYKRAIGYQYDEVTYEQNSEGKKGNVIVESNIKKIVRKELPADVGAATLWLKNRQPDKWRDRDIDLNKLSDQQIDYILEQLLKRNSNEKGTYKRT